MGTGHTRIADEAGKGLETLRSTHAHLFHTVAGSQSPVAVLGPFAIDMDVNVVKVTAGLVPAANAGNIITLYNGTVAANKPIVSFDIAGTVLVAQVPVTVTLDGRAPPAGATVTLANKRVKAGTPISVLGTFAGNDAAAGAMVSVFVEVDPPIGDLNAALRTYGTYDHPF